MPNLVFFFRERAWHLASFSLIRGNPVKSISVQVERIITAFDLSLFLKFQFLNCRSFTTIVNLTEKGFSQVGIDRLGGKITLKFFY